MNGTQPCPVGTFCGGEALKTPSLCPADSYQDEVGQAACKECAGLRDKTGASTYGILGAFASAACVECPEGVECGPSTVRQALHSTGESVGKEVYTAAEYQSANGEGLAATALVADAGNDAWCPSTCPRCIAPVPGNYRFPPNTCVDYGDGCSACPVVGLAERCLACPLSDGVNLANPMPNVQAGNTSALSGCEEAYAGVLCRTCSAGHTRSGEFGCTECIDPALVKVAIFTLLLLGMAVVAYFVKSTLASEGRPSSEGIMMLKLVASHLQLVAM